MILLFCLFRCFVLYVYFLIPEIIFQLIFCIRKEKKTLFIVPVTRLALQHKFKLHPFAGEVYWISYQKSFSYDDNMLWCDTDEVNPEKEVAFYHMIHRIEKLPRFVIVFASKEKQKNCDVQYGKSSVVHILSITQAAHDISLLSL